MHPFWFCVEACAVLGCMLLYLCAEFLLCMAIARLITGVGFNSQDPFHLANVGTS